MCTGMRIGVRMDGAGTYTAATHHDRARHRWEGRLLAQHCLTGLQSGQDGLKVNLIFDLKAKNFAEVAMMFSLLGLFTGMVWAKATWGTFWTADPKLNGTAVTLLIYTAYFILRNSIEDIEKKARISSIYNVFAFVLMIVFD